MQSLQPERKNPMSVKLMGRFGYRHVPDNMLQIIERHGRYHRAEEGPFVRRNPFNENFGAQIRVGVIAVSHLYENVISRDGVAHKVRASVKVFFDIRQADEKVAPILAKHGAGLLENRIIALVDLALRRKMAHMTATQILLPDVPPMLEAAIKKRIEGIKNMGVSMLAIEDGIMVQEILAPERMHDNRTEATNINETIDNFTRSSSAHVKQALLAHLLRDMGNQRPMFKNLSLPEDLNPADDDVLDASFRVMRQPTGRIFDN